MTVLDRLKELTPDGYRLRILAVTIVVIVVPFLGYYLFYIRNQTDYFTDRNFRELSLVSGQITAKVEAAGVVLKNASQKLISPEPPDHEKFNPANEKENLKKLKEFFDTLKDDGPVIEPVSIRAESLSDKISPATVSLTAVRNEGDTSWLYLDYVSDQIRPNKIVRVKGRVDLNSLVQPFMPFSSGSSLDEGRFENILISEADSARVIYQNNPTQVRLASLDKLSAPGDTGKNIDLKEAGKTSSVADVALAGSNYKLFSHPIKFSLSSDAANTPSTAWIVSGLIRADTFRSQVWSISYITLIIFGFIAILLILSWPFLKIILTGKKDRLRTADIYFLVFASIVGIASLTSLVFFVYLYKKTEAHINAQLGTLAEDIGTNFHNEFGDALKQLEAFSNNRALINRLENRKEKGLKDKDIYQQADLKKTDLLTELLKPSVNAPYPYFGTVAWLDDKGKQRAKWTIKSSTAQYVDVSDRDYFKNLRLGHHYKLNETEFWLEPIVSRTTGRSEVEISKLAIDPNWITAFDTQLISLMHPVLPESFGFAIIANDGTVLLHSDDAHNLGENFFQECDDDPALRAAVIGRGGTPLNVRYLGEDHSVLVTTIPEFPDWSLLVLHNKRTLRGSFLELISLLSCLFLVYSLLLLVGFSIFYLHNVNHERRTWLWPSKDKKEIYIQCLLVLLVLSVVSVALANSLHGQKLVWISALIGIASASAFFVILRFGHSGFWRAFSKTVFQYPARIALHRFLYVLNVTFLLLVIAILPAAAFFKYAYETEMKVFTKQAQFSFVEALAKRDDRIRNQYANIKTVVTKKSDKSQPPLNPGPSDFTKQRLNQVDWDIYDKFFKTERSQPTPGMTNTCTADSATETLADLNSYLPFPIHKSIQRQALFDSASVSGICKWETCGEGKLGLLLNSSVSTEIQRPWQRLITAIPLFNANESNLPELKLVWFCIFAAWFLLFPWFVYFIVRRVFLLDVYKPTSSPLEGFLTREIKRNLFVVVDAPFIEKTALPGSNLYLKDLRTISIGPDGAYQFTDLPGLDRVIGLANFDCNLNDPQGNVKKLDLIEDLLQKNRTLMIFSSVEPSHYQFKNGNPGHENGSGDQDGRWAEIMSQFFTDYAEDTGNPENFAKQIEQERPQILARDLKGRSEKEINELIDLVASECKPKGPLQQIGLQILEEDSFTTLGRQHLLKRIVNQALTYYTHIWNSCSMDEKLTLAHLAHDRLLNHRDPDIERLLRRELIVKDEDVHLMNDSFRDFIKSTDQMALMTEHDEKAKQGSSWQSFKGPLLVVLIAITAFLFMTQRDFVTSSLALITGITAIIPAFFKLLSLFQSDPLARPPQQT